MIEGDEIYKLLALISFKPRHMEMAQFSFLGVKFILSSEKTESCAL